MKRRNIVWLIVLLLVVALVGGGLLLYNNLPGLITPRVKEALLQQLNPPGMDIYRVEMNEVIIDRHRGIMFTDILVEPLEEVFTDYDPAQLPAQLFSMKVDGVTVGWNDIISLARDRSTIIINNISIPRATLTLFSNRQSEVKDTLNKDEEVDKIQLNVSKLQVDRLQQRLFPDTATLVFSGRDIALSGKFSYHPRPADSLSRMAIRGLELLTGTIGFLPDSGLYTYHLAHIEYSQAQQVLLLDSFRLAPRYNKREFQKYHTFQNDRIDAALHAIAIHGFDPQRLINGNEFIASEIIINTGSADIYRDKNLPPDTLKRTTMPTRLIRGVSAGLHIEKLTLENITLVYSELAEGGDTPGVVPFRELSATLHNFTNRGLDTDSILRIEARAYLFHTALLKASFMYNLMDAGGGFRVKGEVADFDFTRVNEAVQPLAGFRVAKGNHTRTTFVFTGNDARTQGEVVMLYSDLVVDSGEESRSLKRGVMRFLGRNLVYHPSNPSRDKQRMGTIAFDRNLSRSVFHYWWHSLLSGIKDTVLRDSAAAILDQ
jgi:hypothetical protein